MALKAVVETRAIGYTASLLQPIAIAVVKAAGFGNKLNEDKTRRRGLFCLSKEYIRTILDLRGWRAKGNTCLSFASCLQKTLTSDFTGSYGDSRKAPANALQLGVDMVDRLACMVMKFNIPKELVLNADHTNMAMTPNAGKTGSSKTLKTKEMVDSNDTSVQNANDKRNTTALVCSTAACGMVGTQWIVQGKTASALPQPVGYTETRRGLNSKASKDAEKRGKPGVGDKSACFKPHYPGVSKPSVPSMCVTPNHWSDDVTSHMHAACSR